MSTKASRISNTGRKWINQSATKGNIINIRNKNKSGHIVLEREMKIIKVIGWKGVVWAKVVSSHRLIVMFVMTMATNIGGGVEIQRWCEAWLVLLKMNDVHGTV